MHDFKQQLSDLVDKAIAAGEDHDEIVEALGQMIAELHGGVAVDEAEEPDEYTGLPGEEEKGG